MGVPSNENYSSCARWSYFVTFIGAAFGGWFWYILVKDNHEDTVNAFLITIVVIVVANVIIPTLFGYIVYIVRARSTKCPNCGERFCIKHNDVRTVTESVIMEKDSNGKFVNYRVGVEHIKWECTNCKYQNEGDREYKRKV